VFNFFTWKLLIYVHDNNIDDSTVVDNITCSMKATVLLFSFQYKSNNATIFVLTYTQYFTISLNVEDWRPIFLTFLNTLLVPFY